MSIREAIEQNKAIAFGAAGAVVFLALIFIVVHFTGGGTDEAFAPQSKGFFTIDDGKTWFADSAERLPPFEKDGKQAYRAVVLTCDGGSTKFVSYLMRYTPELRKKLEATAKQPANRPSGEEMSDGTEVKPPGADEKAWVKQSNPAAVAIMTTKCPKGDVNNVTAVEP